MLMLMLLYTPQLQCTSFPAGGSVPMPRPWLTGSMLHGVLYNSFWYMSIRGK